MKAPALPEIDWSRPWLMPWRARGEVVLEIANRCGLPAALNDALIDLNSAPVAEPIASVGGAPWFVRQDELPRGEAYESFIARTGRVPTRDNLHDFFNGLG